MRFGRVLSLVPGDGGRGAFAPGWVRIQDEPPSPAARRTLELLLVMGAVCAAWSWLGRLDVVVVADGRLVPRTLVRTLQSAEGGVVREVFVAEGEPVLAGQLVARLDATVTESEARALRAELVRRTLQRRRADAELAERSFERHAGDPDEAYSTALAQYEANRRVHRDAMLQESAAVERLAQELSAARATERKLERVAPIVRSAAARYGQLHSEGFVSELALLERERDRIEKDHDLDAQRHVVAGLDAALRQAERRLAQVLSGYRRELEAERAQAEGEIVRLGEALSRELHRADHVELRAPAAGVVKDLAARAPGALLAPGAAFATLVPAGDGLAAEVLIRHEDAGVVRVGQGARVKLAAYPFQKYGTLDGRVVHVAPDSTEPATSDRAAGPSGFRARIELDALQLREADESHSLSAGMLASAEIRLGERRVIEYLLSPFQRAWHDAARER